MGQGQPPPLHEEQAPVRAVPRLADLARERHLRRRGVGFELHRRMGEHTPQALCLARRQTGGEPSRSLESLDFFFRPGGQVGTCGHGIFEKNCGGNVKNDKDEGEVIIYDQMTWHVQKQLP